MCGGGPFFYGGFGPNYCFSGVGFWNCGFGGYGLGYGYGGGYGYGVGLNAYPYDLSGSAYDDAPNSDRIDVYGGYIGDGTGNTAGNAPAEPKAPPAQIILKDGSAYEVIAYWVSNGELYYRPVTGGLSHVPVDQLDLSATVEANSRNGVTFSLTDRAPQE